MGKIGRIIIQAAIGAAIAFATAGAGLVAGGTFFSSVGFTVGVTSLKIAAATVSFIGSAALGFAQLAFSGEGNRGGGAGNIPAFTPSFASTASQELRQFSSPAQPWSIHYGEARTSGPTVFVESTGNNKFLHLIIVLAGHEVESIKHIFMNGEPFYNDEFNSNGFIKVGKFANKVRVIKHLGSVNQLADSDLVSEVEQWTNEHRIRGRTYIAIRLEFERDLYPSGVPSFSVGIKGHRLFDPRDGSEVWSTNPALAIRKYWTTPTEIGGMGFIAANDVDDTFIMVAANACDEFVLTQDLDSTVKSVDISNDALVLVDDVSPFQTGDKIQVTSTGTLPGGITAATDFFTIINKLRKTDTSDTEISLANSYKNSLAEVAVNITSTGSGTITVTKKAEPRFTCNGILQTGQTTGNNLSNLLTSLAGRASHIGSDWKLYAGVPQTPILTFDEDDIVGDLVINTKQPRRDRFNAVKGTYASPLDNSVPNDYPAVVSTFFKAEDNGETIHKDLELPFTNRPHTAQRIAKINLFRSRQEISLSVTMQPTAFKFQPGTWINLSLERMGWVNQIFECIEWGFATVVGDDALVYVCPIALRGISSAVYDWNASEETLVLAAPTTILPDPFAPNPPKNLQVREEILITNSGGGVKSRAIVTYEPPDDSFIVSFVLEHKFSSEPNFIVLAANLSLTQNLDDFIPGLHDFRVKGINNLGFESPFITLLNFEIIGLSAKPATPTNLTIVAIGGLANLSWDKSTDLDVTEGGTIHIRHDSDIDNPSLATSVSLVAPIDGADTVVVLPLKEGAYFIFFADTSDIRSDAVFVTSEQVTVQEFTNLSLISEQPVFTGVKVNTIVVGGVLQLGPADVMDDWTDVDTILDFDTGESGIISAGTYFFASSFDFGSKVRKRLTTIIKVTTIATDDTIDGRLDNIDDWLDFDGIEGSDTDALIFVRFTDDDPSGSPVFSTFQRLESAEFHARAFQFKVELTTASSSFNIQISELSIRAEDLV